MLIKIFQKVYIGFRKGLGNIFCIFGKYDMALNMYFKALHYGPRRPDIYFSMGKTFLFMGNINEAVKFFEKSIEFDKFNPTYIKWLFQVNNLENRYSSRQILS